MTDRDEEMDQLQQELAESIRSMESEGARPFIERPEKMDLRAGSLCWMDGTRVCGPDCVAYNLEEFDPESGDLLQGPNKCLPLLYMGQQGAVALQQLIINRKRIVEIQDRKRREQMNQPPPDPFGGNRT